jgi:hypothetical protein
VVDDQCDRVYGVGIVVRRQGDVRHAKHWCVDSGCELYDDVHRRRWIRVSDCGRSIDTGANLDLHGIADERSIGRRLATHLDG